MNSYFHCWHEGDAVGLPNGKAVCVGRNYADHIEEMNSAVPEEPVLFIKPTTALCSASEQLRISHLQSRGEVHHELEIAVLVGETLNATSQNHTQAIHGLGLGIDLTLRGLQSDLKQKRLPWERAKSFDGSCLLSTFLRYDSSTLALDDLSLTLSVNGHIRQQSNSALMLYSITALLKNISEVFTLLPGDIVLTGTPSGVGPLVKGDQISGQLNTHTLIEKTNVI